MGGADLSRRELFTAFRANRCEYFPVNVRHGYIGGDEANTQLYNLLPGLREDIVNAGESFLDIRASPWAEVTLDGKSLGPTPMGSVRVKPGSHTLVLSNPQIKKRKTMTVTVEAGKTKRIAVDLFD